MDKLDTESKYFKIIGQDGDARSGEIYTHRGKIVTPDFMPVGTAATVKGLLPESLKMRLSFLTRSKKFYSTPMAKKALHNLENQQYK